MQVHSSVLHVGSGTSLDLDWSNQPFMKIDIEKTYYFTKSHKGHVHTLCGGFAKVLQLITIFEGGGSSQSITVLQFLDQCEFKDCVILNYKNML